MHPDRGVHRAVGAVAQEGWTTCREDPVDGHPGSQPDVVATARGYVLAMDRAEDRAAPAGASRSGRTVVQDVSSGTGGTPGTGGRSGVDRVELSVPADPAYLAVLRTATAGLAARADLTIDEIEDLRIAVDEACALVLGEPASTRSRGVKGASAPVTPTIDAVFELSHHGVAVRVSGPSRLLPERTSFAWSVLEALVDVLDAGTDEDGRHTITLRHGTRRPA